MMTCKLLPEVPSPVFSQDPLRSELCILSSLPELFSIVQL